MQRRVRRDQGSSGRDHATRSLRDDRDRAAKEMYACRASGRDALTAAHVGRDGAAAAHAGGTARLGARGPDCTQRD